MVSPVWHSGAAGESRLRCRINTPGRARMADKSDALLTAALRRAVAEPTGLPLFGTKTRPGLFTANAAGKQLAARCKELGLLRTLHEDARAEVCALSEK